MLVTALVQSSSAVTVAAIGFVNAGLLALGPALWVLFGANVGTTMTGWIVTRSLVSLDTAIEHFVERLRSASMSQVASTRLAELLRIQRYHEASAERAAAAALHRSPPPTHAWPRQRWRLSRRPARCSCSAIRPSRRVSRGSPILGSPAASTAASGHSPGGRTDRVWREEGDRCLPTSRFRRAPVEALQRRAGHRSAGALDVGCHSGGGKLPDCRSRCGLSARQALNLSSTLRQVALWIPVGDELGSFNRFKVA